MSTALSPYKIKIGNARLLKLCAFLDTLPPEKFHYRCVVKEARRHRKHICGTVCCAWGWTPRVFPKLVKWDDDGTSEPIVRLRNACGDTFRGAGPAKLFYINYIDKFKIFAPGCAEIGYSGLRENATNTEVAAHIRAFVAEREKLL